MSQMPARDWDEIVDRAAWSILCGVMAAFLLLPLFASIAHGQTADGATDMISPGPAWLVPWAVGLSFAVEFIRSLVPAWRRGVKADPKALAAVDAARAIGLDSVHVEVLRRLAVATGGPGELAKTLLRVVPVALGFLAPLVFAQMPIDQTLNPGPIGGVGAGFVSSLWGGSIVKFFRSRLPGADAHRAGPTDDEAQP